MSEPQDGRENPESEPRSVLELLRDPTVIVLVVSVAMLIIVYYHQGRFVGLPEKAVRARLGWFALNFICLFMVPTLLLRLVLRRSVADVGWRPGDLRLQARYFLLFGAVTIPVILIASRFGDFQGYYGRYAWLRDDIRWLIAFEVGWLVYFFAWEFFFRGFLLFTLGERFGAVAIALQTVPFVLMHFAKPEMESVAAIIAGIALGWWAWRSRSFVGPWLLHWVCSATMMLSVMFWPPG